MNASGVAEQFKLLFAFTSADLANQASLSGKSYRRPAFVEILCNFEILLGQSIN